MHRRDFLALSAAAGLVPQAAFGQQPPADATVTLRPEREIGRISPHLYGHFLEHLENVIYGGIFDAGSPRANATGIRTDVVRAIAEMGGAHIIRWPGGNFVSAYHWEDGIGPRARRPRRLDVVFDQYESNHFGTDEYLELCRLTGAEPFITVNMGSGSVLEACRWVEYCRRQKRQPPVRIWGLGNEHWGPWQMGYYTPQQYAERVQQYAQFMRVVEPDIRYVGVGHTEGDWNRVVLERVGASFDWLSIHLYGHRNFLDGVDDFDSTVVTPVWFERSIQAMVGEIEAHERTARRARPLEITLEEWNTRHTRNNGQLWRNSPRNIVDALFTALTFNVLNRHSARVTMSNFVFLLNTHAPIAVTPGGVLRSATFDVFRLFATLSRPVAIATEVRAPSFTASITPVKGWNEDADTTPMTASRLDASATRSVDGRRLTLFLVNRDRSRPMRVTVNGAPPALSRAATLHLLAADSLTAVNTPAAPDRVRSRATRVADWRAGVTLPPASAAVVEV